MVSQVAMPVLVAVGKATPTNFKIAGQENAFTKDATYKVIAAKTNDVAGTLSGSTANAKKAYVTAEGLVIDGVIKADSTRAKKTKNTEVPQFKVVYTVSAIKKNATITDGTVGDAEVVGYTYVGDDKAAAMMK